MGGIKEGFAEPVTCEMELDGGVEAHQGQKKSMNSVQKWENAAMPPKSCGYKFHVQVWAPAPAQNSPLSSGPVRGMGNRGS